MPQTVTPPYDGRELEALTVLSNYRDWILDGFAPYLKGRAVEIGAGIGTMTLLLRPLVDSLVAVEPATNLLPTLAQRLVGSDVDLVVATASDYLKNAPAASLDALVMINVLEHIAEHQDTLRGCHRALARGGYLLLFVPALPTLFGSLDRQFGHHRRYRHAELRQDLVASGFSIVRLSYVDLAGVIAWYVAGRILGAASISAGSARAYDRLIVPLMRPIERFVRPPFGKNLMAVARA